MEIIPVLFLIALYMLPSIIAGYNSHPKLNAIIILNVLTGWTFFGWVGALLWAIL